jgi:hypothetical protein
VLKVCGTEIVVAQWTRAATPRRRRLLLRDAKAYSALAAATIGAQLVHNSLQMRCSDANGNRLNETKYVKIGEHEQSR